MLHLNIIPFPDLVTERLNLRQLRNNDDHEIFALRSDIRVNEYLERPITTSIHEAREFIEKINNGIANQDCFYWAISLKEDEKLIGTICYWNISTEAQSAEIGYELHPDFQGKGIMQEAISRVIKFGFEKVKIKTITACPSRDNYKSVKLLEKKNFIMEKPTDDKINNEANSPNTVTYSLANPDWIPAVIADDSFSCDSSESSCLSVFTKIM
jgi:[ribosomal protein S5]-alanine N-acetyltransferase